MNEQTSTMIKKAIGSHAVFLAVRHDPELVGRFKKTEAGTLFMDGDKINKAKLASVLIYLTGKWGMRPTEFELYTGILGASQEVKVERKKNSLPEREVQWAKEKLNRDHVAMSTTDIIEKLPAGMLMQGRSGEMRLARILDELGWERKRTMIHNIRAYRWYPPEDWVFQDVEAPQAKNLENVVDYFDHIEDESIVLPEMEVRQTDGRWTHPVAEDDESEHKVELDPWGDPVVVIKEAKEIKHFYEEDEE